MKSHKNEKLKSHKKLKYMGLLSHMRRIAGNKMKLMLIFYFMHLLLIICHNISLNSFGNIFRLVLIFLAIIFQISTDIIKKTIIQNVNYPIFLKFYFFLINSLNTLIFIEFDANIDASSPLNEYHYFWMGYRLFSINIIIKLISNQPEISIISFLFELFYINYKLNTFWNEEFYKAILISALIFFFYSYLFIMFEDGEDGREKRKIFKKNDKIWIKTLNRLNSGILIIDEKEEVYFGNNAIMKIISENLDIKTRQNIFSNVKEFLSNLRLFTPIESEVNDRDFIPSLIGTPENYDSFKNLDPNLSKSKVDLSNFLSFFFFLV